MLKALLAGATALTLIGGPVVYAQQATPTQPNSGVAQTRPRFTPEEFVTRTNARIGELKTELHLTSAQEKNWAAFETALRESAKQRAEHLEQIRKLREQAAGQPQGNMAERSGGRAEPTAAEIADQKRLAAALDPLYKSLDEGQKQRFATLFRVDGEGRHFWFRRGEHRTQDQRS